VVELYKEGSIDRAEFDRETQFIVNRLRTTVPAEEIIEVVPKPGFRWVLEEAGIIESPGKLPGDSSLVSGDPEGIQVRQYPRRLAPFGWEPRA
jgi:hypothetical protein